MANSRWESPSSHYLALFEAAPIKIYADEAEWEINLDGDDLAVSLRLVDGKVPPEALTTARSVLGQVVELDALAFAFLKALDGWPYHDDALLWLIIVEPENVRFCYQQESVNDEQVVGFVREGTRWMLSGTDKRHRG